MCLYKQLDSPIDNFIQGCPDKRIGLMQLIKSIEQLPKSELPAGPKIVFIRKILDYSIRKSINLHELHDFVAFIDQKIEKCTEDADAARMLWGILNYATGYNTFIFPKLADNFQRILDFFIKGIGSGGSDTAVAELLEYASTRNLPIENINDLLKKINATGAKKTMILVNFYLYAYEKNPDEIKHLMREFANGILREYVVHRSIEAVCKILENAEKFGIDYNMINDMRNNLLSQPYDSNIFTLNNYISPTIFDNFLQPFIVREFQKSDSKFTAHILRYCIDKGIALDSWVDIPNVLENAFFPEKENLYELLFEYSIKNKISLNIEKITASIVSNNFWKIMPSFLKYIDKTGQEFNLTELIKKIIEIRYYGCRLSDMLDFINEKITFNLQECLDYARSFPEQDIYRKEYAEQLEQIKNNPDCF
jgi:hypothetical protein